MNQSLPAGFGIRPPTIEDLSGIAALLNACDLADGDQPETTANELMLEFKRTGFNLEADAWVITRDEDGLVVGYAEVWNRKNHASLSGDSYVLPQYRDLGLGITLLELIEDRASEHILLASPELAVMLRNGVSGADKLACKQHEQLGYTPARYFWRMEIYMQNIPQQPVWPPGITVRNVIPGPDDRSVFDALEEAFMDHWGDAPWDFETWRVRRFTNEDFDPSLWFLAMDGDNIAGATISRYRGEYGWVSQLAVRRPWRRLGLGLALLRQSFAEFYRRGTSKVGLTVDAQNPTGATRLYEHAGMRTTNEYIVYEKEPRPGKKI